MRNKLSSQQKQEEYLKKLKLVDRFLINSETSYGNSMSTDEIFTMLASKFVPDPPQELTPSAPKVILFNEKVAKRFVVREQTADKGRQFILHVTAHAPVKISIGTNEEKPKFYSFDGTKAILIPALSWKQLHISVSMEKANMFSSVKLNLEQIKIQHKNHKKANVNMRPKIDEELEQYLRETKGKITEIVRSRSMARIKESQSRRRFSSTATIKTAQSAEMARTKSELLKFQKKKTFYIRHVEKMSPEKMKQYKQSEANYCSKKQRLMGELAKLILTMKMGLHIRSQQLLIRKKRFRQLKINLLCMDFVKIIKNKFRLKMTEKARLRMVNLHYLHSMPAIYYQSSIKHAKTTIIQSLMPYMEFRGLQQLAANSEDYLNSVGTLQSFIKSVSRSFRERIGIIVDRLSVIYHIDLSEKEKATVVEKFFRECQEKKTTKFYLNKNRLLEIMREEFE